METKETAIPALAARLNNLRVVKIVQPACRDLEYIIECQVDMMSGQMQVM